MENRNRYMYGSAAPKLPQNPERREPARRETTVPATQKAVSAYAQVPKAKLFLGVMTLSVMCFVMLYRFSILTDMNSKMGSMTSDFSGLRDQNRLLRVEIAGVNLDNVKQIAEEQLGMHKPDKFQVVPVSVPKNDYSVVLDQQYINDAAGPKKSFFENAVDAISAAFP